MGTKNKKPYRPNLRFIEGKLKEGKADIFDELKGYEVFDYDIDKMRKVKSILHHLLEQEEDNNA